MTTKIEATFDGEVFRPSGEVSLPPNTTVRITVEAIPADPVPAEPIPAVATQGEPYSSLRVMLEQNLEGPPDWASNLDFYLYGKDRDDAG